MNAAATAGTTAAEPPSTQRPAILLDCDPGHDDVIAMLLAAQASELVGVTAVSGNAPLERTLHNALITCQVAGLDVPVVAGADRPLVAEARHAANIHGASGLDGPVLPRLRRRPAPGTAVRFILERAEERDDLWMVATGPLTNLALALREDPDLARRLRGISIMGGASGAGNVTASAEFNIWADPEAAAIVLGSGARIVMAELRVTHAFMVGSARRQRVAALGTEVARFVAELLEAYGAAYARSFGGDATGPMHDACAVLAVTHPQLFTSTPRHVVVELRGEHTRGRTVIDERGGGVSRPANASVLADIDDEAAFEVLLDALAAYA